jgi:peptidoglycan/LPS O-acetylase OafA/YrhL
MIKEPMESTHPFVGKHIPALDGIRALAVFVVILYHSGAVTAVPGDLGVEAFFVLSGFLITTLLIREYERTGSISFRGFYRRRTLRIFPAYYAYIAFSLTIDTLRHHPWSKGLLLAGLGYVVNYYNAALGHPTTSVAHAWSLAVEEQFYLIWPVLFLLLWKAGSTRTAKALSIAIVVVLLWRSFALFQLNASAAYLYNTFESRADALAIGCLAGVLAGKESARPMLSAIRRYQWFPLLTLGLLVLSRLDTARQYHYTLGMTFETILLCVLMLQLIGLADKPLWSWIENPVIKWLGAISYGCYLYHGWGLTVGEHLVPKGLPVGLEFTVGYLVTIALAYGSYIVVERPFLRLKERSRVVRPTPGEAA